jgi:hypothetical protein
MDELTDSVLSMSKDGTEATITIKRTDGEQVTLSDVILELDYHLKALQRTQKSYEDRSVQ